jgi:hypothetical protein
MGQNLKIIKKEKTNNMTAVEWLIERLHLNNEELGLIPIDIIQQAKAMEKEQIIKAYLTGYVCEEQHRGFESPENVGIKYYNANYGSNTNL